MVIYSQHPQENSNSSIRCIRTAVPACDEHTTRIRTAITSALKTTQWLNSPKVKAEQAAPWKLGWWSWNIHGQW